MPDNVEGLIDGSVDFPFRQTVDFVGAAVEERFQTACHCGAALRRWKMLGRNGRDADLLVRRNRPAQKLFHGGLHRLG
jgi:hypothetical protein